VYRDIAYATLSPAEKLDIYLPWSGSRPYPVIVAIHGGAFKIGDKTDRQLTPMLAGLDRGYAVVSVNYRFSREATAPAQINDVKAAIRFLRANASIYHLDAEKIAVWGGSAGGNLAALAGTAGDVAALSDASQGNASRSERVQAVVDWYGLIDLGTMDAQLAASGAGPIGHDRADSPESDLLGAALPSVPDAVRRIDPTTYITADDPPFLIEHGTADDYVPVQQSEAFAAALTRTLGADKVELELLPGAGHADPAFETSAGVAFVLDWLDRRLR
jgi:acetyl esterase/lipase